MPTKYYAVKQGRKTGIYTTWDECKKQVTGFSGAIYKSFPTKAAAQDFLEPQAELAPAAPSAENGPDFRGAQAVAYVDGSYLHRAKKFSYGAVIYYKGEEYSFSEAFDDPSLAEMRNVAGEIMGARRAMEFCIEHQIESITIYYDYQGIESWCTGAWKANKPGTIAYKQFYDTVTPHVKVQFVKVKGHSGDFYNDLVDSLAKKALGIETA